MLLVYLYKCFSLFPSVFFQRLLITAYIHTSSFVLICKSPHFPHCVRRSQPLTDGGVYRGKYAGFLTKGGIHPRSCPRVKSSITHLVLSVTSGFATPSEWPIGYLSNGKPVWEVPKLPRGRVFKDEKKIWAWNHPLINVTQKKTESGTVVSHGPLKCEMKPISLWLKG